MLVFKCKMCGGEMELEEGATVAECPYCLTKQTLPKLSNDKRANMYDRANHFRRQNEYDKAMAIFESILQEDRTDAEAYWSLVLCRYGIEYVEDPATHKRVPTVNRVQYTSILSDEDYKSALEYADFAQRSVYESEAKAIDEIQKGILAISKQEKPFDVFICYKETDANGRRTPDSVLANDLYHQLTNEGFKVFFSRITLEDKIGIAYEPYIFAALNSAKVMVVLGTKPEYFNAVWVKNEWSRYLALIRAGAEKTLVPAYRDMDPYDLPEEFSHLQAQDMGKLGFMQDLIRGIKKLTKKETSKPQTVVQQNVGAGANIDNLMKRVRLFLEDSDFSSADEYLDRVLDENAEYAPAYIGKVLVKQRFHKEEELGSTLLQYEKDPNWAKALRFATPEQKEKYDAYLEKSKQKRREKYLHDQYTAALKALTSATDEHGCYQAKSQFTQISSYKDSRERMEECDKKALRIAYDRAEKKRLAIMQQNKTASNAKELEKLAPEFEKLGDYYDAKPKAQLCRNDAASMRDSLYHAANKRLNGAKSVSEVEEAEKTFTELGNNYRDVSNKLAKCKEKKELYTKYEQLDARKTRLIKHSPSVSVAKQFYELAEQYQSIEGSDHTRSMACLARAAEVRSILYQGAVNAKNAADSISSYERAMSLFKELEGYSDSNEQIDVCQRAIDQIRGQEAKALRKKRNTKIAIVSAIACCIAIAIFVTQYVIPKGKYNQAVALRAEGKYDEAISAFTAIRNYSDAAEQLAETKYRSAVELQQARKFEEAITAFEALNGYGDSAAQIEACRTSIKERDYQAAVALQRAGRYIEAIIAFTALNGYGDSVALIEACQNSIRERDYQAAVALQQAGKYEEAITAFEALNGYGDSAAQIEVCRTSIKERDYQAAVALQQAGRYEEAIIAFEALNGYGDSTAQIEASIKERDYKAAVALQQAGRYEEAIIAFEALNGFGDSATQITETKYLKAKSLAAKGDYAGAAAIFIGIKGYKDVDSLLANDHNLVAAARDAKYSVGNYVTFGHYPQTSGGNDNTEIEWLVLARDGNKALLISRYGLDAKPYNEEHVNITWEKCTLRTWLNGTFLNKAFTAQEQKGILTTTVNNGTSQGYSAWWLTRGENNTQDRIFLLSYAEANKYLSVQHYSVSGSRNNTKSRVAPTAYAIKQGADNYSSNKTADGTTAGCWWLRSPGNNKYAATVVFTDGSLSYHYVNSDSDCVRPALWINLESDIF